MKKTLTLLLIAIIAIGLIGALVKFSKIESASFAVALNFVLMLCMLLFTDALKSPLASAYYDEKPWERKGKLYESLGIHFFRKILVWIGWEKLNKKAKPVEKNVKALAHLHLETKKSEFNHLVILFIVLGFNVFVAFKFGPIKSLWLLATNVLLNLYPILLQRYNRPRIARALILSQRR